MEKAIVATLVAKPGKREAALALLTSMVTASRKEEGNLQYDLHESSTEPGTFVFVERWKSDDAITFHRATPHFQHYLKTLDDIFVSRVSTLMQKIPM